MGESDELNRWLSSFICEKDRDIEDFLHTKAIKYEELSKSRTYFIVDEEQLIQLIKEKEENQVVNMSDLIMYGYFSLALKVLSVPEQLSTNQRKNIDGLSAKIHGEVISDFPCYLIGQLARNSAVTKSAISGVEIINHAFSIIKAAMLNVGGCAILIECRNDKKLIDFYIKNGFKLIDTIPDGENVMNQMLRIIVI